MVRIALLSIDVDFGEATKVVLETFYPLVVSGGIVLFDDYGTCSGATCVVDQFLTTSNQQLQILDFAKHPAFLIKGRHV
jgi:hypothetical protein